MKRLIVLTIVLALLLTGCSWMDGEYHSVTPHSSAGNKVYQGTATVSNYDELRAALFALVTDGRTKGTFYAHGMDDDMIERYMKTAIVDVFQNSAVGAYAAEEINYKRVSAAIKPQSLWR